MCLLFANESSPSGRCVWDSSRRRVQIRESDHTVILTAPILGWDGRRGRWWRQRRRRQTFPSQARPTRQGWRREMNADMTSHQTPTICCGLLCQKPIVLVANALAKLHSVSIRLNNIYTVAHVNSIPSFHKSVTLIGLQSTDQSLNDQLLNQCTSV